MISKIIYFLFFLIFFSKISFNFIGIFPKAYSFIFFQHGLHPALNFILQIVFGFILIMSWLVKKDRFKKLTSNYIIMIIIGSLILTIQTVLQIIFCDSDSSIITYLSGLLMALTLIILYGLVIPTFISGIDFIKVTLNTNIPIAILSLALSPFFWNIFQKGGRFIGIYKHIPHMVTASSMAYMFSLSIFIFNFNNMNILRKIFYSFISIIFLIASILTFTKAMYFSISLFTLAAPFVLGPKRNSFVFFKTILMLCFITITILLGYQISSKLIDYSTGKESIGLRHAQNGVESRTEEVFRGIEIFKKAPFLGQGILYKYMNNKNKEVEVESYNSFKDPHNLIVSAGVIGGIPLAIYTVFGYFGLIFTSLTSLFSNSFEKRLFSLFILCHIPVLFIYHAHLSLGGIADRVYWLAIGFMCKKSN